MQQRLNYFPTILLFYLNWASGEFQHREKGKDCFVSKNRFKFLSWMVMMGVFFHKWWICSAWYFIFSTVYSLQFQNSGHQKKLLHKRKDPPHRQNHVFWPLKLMILVNQLLVLFLGIAVSVKEEAEYAWEWFGWHESGFGSCIILLLFFIGILWKKIWWLIDMTVRARKRKADGLIHAVWVFKEGNASEASKESGFG